MTKENHIPENVDIIIENATILPVNSEGDIYNEATLVIKNGKIKETGDSKKLKNKYKAKKYIDGSGKLLMPGLINTHTHSAMTIFRGFADDLPLKEWLNNYVFPFESRFINADTVIKGTFLAILEMIRCGTTTYNDMYYFEDEVAQISKKAGIRVLLGEGILDFPTPNKKTPRDTIQYVQDLYSKWQDDELVNLTVSPHSPFTCSPELLKQAHQLAQSLKLPYHIHLAETRWECDQIAEKYKKTPTRFLADLGVLDENTIAAHAVHLNGEDREILAQSGAGVAHNPECNMKLTSGIAPITDYLKRGIKVGMGTDGVASNNNLDMFQEIHTAALLHKISTGDPQAADARSMVEMATINAAKVLGMDNEIGTLEPGKKADVIIIDLRRPHLVPNYNIYSQIVYSMNGMDVETVIVNGKIIMENREFPDLDKEKVFQDVEKIACEIMNQDDYKLNHN